MGHTDRILQALEDGPGTQRELAYELEIPSPVCRATLRKMYLQGRVTRQKVGASYVYTRVEGLPPIVRPNHTGRILAALEHGSSTQRGLAEALGIDRDIVSGMLCKLARSGRVSRQVTDGVFVYTRGEIQSA